MKRLLLISRIVGCLLLGCGARALAQNRSADFGESVAFEEIPGALHDASEPVLKKMSDLLGVVEGELSADRVSEKVAQELRSAMANVPPLMETEFPAALSTPQLNTTDEAIAKAAADLESAWKLCANRRAALLRQADSEARERVSKVARTAKRALDVDPLLRTLLRVDASPPKRFGPDRQVTFEAINFLRTLRETFDPSVMDDPGSEAAVLRDLRKAGLDDAKTRIDDCKREAEREEESSHAALDALLLSGGSFERTRTAFLAYQTACLRCQMLIPSQRYYAEPYGPLCQCVELIEKRQWSDARLLIEETRPILSRLDRAHELRFGEFLDQKDAEVAKEIESERLGRKAKLWAEINGSKRPEQLDAIAARLRIMTPDSPGEGPGGFAQEFPDILVELSAAWKGSDPHFFVGTPGPERRRNASQLPAELAGLRLRAERDVWSRFLNAPELIEPPLADQPPETAFGNLCKRLSTDGKWQRLLELLKTRDSAAPIPQSGPESKAAMQSIRAFLAGRNFELAEEWADAVAAYKTVLQSRVDGTLMKEATERLAILTKER